MYDQPKMNNCISQEHSKNKSFEFVYNENLEIQDNTNLQSGSTQEKITKVYENQNIKKKEFVVSQECSNIKNSVFVYDENAEMYNNVNLQKGSTQEEITQTYERQNIETEIYNDYSDLKSQNQQLNNSLTIYDKNLQSAEIKNSTIETNDSQNKDIYVESDQEIDSVDVFKHSKLFDDIKFISEKTHLDILIQENDSREFAALDKYKNLNLNDLKVPIRYTLKTIKPKKIKKKSYGKDFRNKIMSYKLNHKISRSQCLIHKGNPVYLENKKHGLSECISDRISVVDLLNNPDIGFLTEKIYSNAENETSKK